MFSYKDNPNLGLRTVVTKSGKTEYRENCRKINHEYFIKNEECFQIEDKWFRLESGLIVKDYGKNEYILKSDANKLTWGLVGFDEKIPIFGYFTPNPYLNCDVKIKALGEYKALNTDILLENGYCENFSTGVWAIEADPNKAQKPANVLDHTGKGYNLEDNSIEYPQKVQLYNNFKTELSKDVRAYAKMLGDISFGIEIECSKGYLPNYLQNRLGVVVCRDGSLNDANGKPGPEFVSIPLTGAKGLQTVSDICKELSKRTEIDIKCSLHLHIGNVPTTRIFLVSLLRLGGKIQNELFSMFPFYKTNPQGIKHKNYCQKMPSLNINAIDSCNKEAFDEYINSSYKKLFSWLSEGYQPDQNCNRKLKQHPVNMKWSRHKRYYWLNTMNAIFSARNTIEFRLHTPTTNSQKTINWLFICNAIIKYANSHAKQILMSRNGITLREVLEYYRGFGQRGELLYNYLNAYVQERKDKFYQDYLKNDKLSEWEMKEDKQYSFVYENTSHLF